jgi:hypothetical protein
VSVPAARCGWAQCGPPCESRGEAGAGREAPTIPTRLKALCGQREPPLQLNGELATGGGSRWGHQRKATGNVSNTSTLRQRSPPLWAHPREIISYTQTPTAPGAAATARFVDNIVRVAQMPSERLAPSLDRRTNVTPQPGWIPKMPRIGLPPYLGDCSFRTRRPQSSSNPSLNRDSRYGANFSSRLCHPSEPHAIQLSGAIEHGIGCAKAGIRRDVAYDR